MTDARPADFQGNVHDLADARLRSNEKVPPLQTAGGGGTSGNVSDRRLGAIEARLGVIESEQRTHLRWMVTIAFVLAALFVTGFGVVLVRIDRTEDKLARLDDRIGRLESSVAEVPGKISSNLMQLNQTLLQAIIASRPEPQRPQLPPPQELPPR